MFRGEDRDIAMMRTDSPPRPKTFEKAKKKKKSEDEEGEEDEEKTEETIEVFPDTVAFAHPDSSGFRAVVASPADERDPHWLPDGSGFVLFVGSERHFQHLPLSPRKRRGRTAN